MSSTSRIRLARVTPADAADLIAANCASRSHHLPWVAAPTDQAGFDQWYARTLSGPNLSLIARESASGEVVGVINLNEIVMGVFKSAYLGYYGMQRFSRTGMMTEALIAAAAFAFDELGLHRLEANIQPDNHASLALARRAGFQKEGYSPRYLFLDGAWRDHERWALLAD
jgi:[ribosomal protein S5]-alanine N-acetyltransferase